MTLTVLSGGCTRLFTWIMRQSDVLPQNILKNWPSVQVWTVLHTLVPCPFCSNVSVQQAALQGSLRELRETNAFRLFLQPIRQGLSVFSGKWDCFWVCLFFSWNYTFLWALYGKLLSLLMFKTCLIASPSRNWVQYVIHYLQCVFFFGNDTLQESSNGKGKLMEFIILLSFLSSVPLGRGRLILLLMVRIQKGTSRFFF